MERGTGGRYSLSLHHSREELMGFGLDSNMLADQARRPNRATGSSACLTSARVFPHPPRISQDWNAIGDRGGLNPDWPTSSNAFFARNAHLIPHPLPGGQEE